MEPLARLVPPRWLVVVVLVAAGAVPIAAGLPRYLGGGAPAGGDTSSHIAEIARIAELIGAGETDFWFDQTDLGYPLFITYQPLPSAFMGVLSALLGDSVSPIVLVKLSILALLGVMPLTWYVGGRWLGMDRLGGLLFGLLLLAVSDRLHWGFGAETYLSTAGLYTQAFGMVLLPLALGALHRHLVREEIGPKLPAVLLSVTLLCHVFFALYALEGALLMVILERRGALRRLRRLAVVGGATAALTAFFVVPFLAYLGSQGGLPPSTSKDGYPLAEIARLLVGGELFDAGRLPWLTAVVFAGVAIGCWRRREGLERWALLLLAMSLVLFLGRTTLGGLYTSLPLHGEVPAARYLGGIHFSGLLLGALGLSRLFTALFRVGWLRGNRVLLGCLLIAPFIYLAGWYQLLSKRLTTFDYRVPDYAALTRHLRAGRGRFLCHGTFGTGGTPYENLLPMLAGRPQVVSYARGFHDTLSTRYLDASYFTPDSYRLYNIRSVVLRLAQPGFEMEAPPHLEVRFRAGSYRVLEAVEDFGYFEFVRTPVTVASDSREAPPALRELIVPLFAAGVVARFGDSESGDRLVVRSGGRLDRYAGGTRVAANALPVELIPALLSAHGGHPRRSRVLAESLAPNRYRARVLAAGGEERLMLKVSHHPLWHASIDGREVEIDHVAPNFMAIDVPAGTHQVELRFRNPLYQKLAFVLTPLGAAVWLLRRSPRRRPGRPSPVRR